MNLRNGALEPELPLVLKPGILGAGWARVPAESWSAGEKSGGKNAPRNPPHGLPENPLNAWPALTAEKRVRERARTGESARARGREEKAQARRGRARGRALTPPLIGLSSPGSALCKLGQAAVLFVLPKSSLRSLGLPLFYFHGLLTSLSFSFCRFGLLFPILPT